MNTPQPNQDYRLQVTDLLVVLTGVVLFHINSVGAADNSKKQSVDPHDTGALVEMLGESIDSRYPSSSTQSANLKMCLRAYGSGNLVEGRRMWKLVLNDMKKEPNIDPITRYINAQSFFGDEKTHINGGAVFRDILKTTRAELGERHQFVADICSVLYEWDVTSANWSEAIDCRKTMMNCYENSSGKASRLALKSRLDLVDTLIKVKKYSDAEKFLKQALVISKSQKDLHQRALTTYRSLLKSTGRNEEAKQLVNKHRS